MGNALPKGYCSSVGIAEAADRRPEASRKGIMGAEPDAGDPPTSRRRIFWPVSRDKNVEEAVVQGEGRKAMPESFCLDVTSEYAVDPAGVLPPNGSGRKDWPGFKVLAGARSRTLNTLNTPSNLLCLIQARLSYLSAPPFAVRATTCLTTTQESVDWAIYWSISTKYYSIQFTMNWLYGVSFH
jgi:hypothetical protein